MKKLLLVLPAMLSLFRKITIFDDLDKGWIAYRNGDYTTALKIWKSIAETGDANAQFNLGVMFDTGKAVERDIKVAVAWYRKAADQGYANAQYNLGVLYDNGDGVEQDARAAAYWYRKAAEQGVVKSHYNLGVLYDNGVKEFMVQLVEGFRRLVLILVWISAGVAAVGLVYFAISEDEYGFLDGRIFFLGPVVVIIVAWVNTKIINWIIFLACIAIITITWILKKIIKI